MSALVLVWDGYATYMKVARYTPEDNRTSQMTLVSRIDMCSALAFLWEGYATFCVMAVG